MDKIFTWFAVVAGALLLSGNLASAAPPGVCYAFTNEAVFLAEKVRQLGGCGLNLNDESLSTNRAVHLRWCGSVLQDTVDTRSQELREQANRCSGCNAYANLITAAAVDNIKYGCGFKNTTDERWKPDKAFHFNGCMAVQDCERICALFSCYSACLVFDHVRQSKLDPVVADVTQKIAECKLTHHPVSCRACHGSNASSAALAAPKSWDAFQDAVKRLTPPAKTSTKSGNDLSSLSDTSNRRATLPRGSNTSGNDLAKPSGEDSTGPSDPSRRRATPAKGSNTGAMDRLSGDSQLPSSGSPGSTGGGNRRVPAGGGGSAVAKPVINTPSPSIKAGPPPVDSGNCASCGRPPTPPR